LINYNNKNKSKLQKEKVDLTKISEIKKIEKKIIIYNFFKYETLVKKWEFLYVLIKKVNWFG